MIHHGLREYSIDGDDTMPKFNVNDRVYSRYEHKGVSGIIVEMKVTRLPFGMGTLTLYNVKMSDGHTAWINELYLHKVDDDE